MVGVLGDLDLDDEHVTIGLEDSLEEASFHLHHHMYSHIPVPPALGRNIRCNRQHGKKEELGLAGAVPMVEA